MENRCAGPSAPEQQPDQNAGEKTSKMLLVRDNIPISNKVRELVKMQSAIIVADSSGPDEGRIMDTDEALAYVDGHNQQVTEDRKRRQASVASHHTTNFDASGRQHQPQWHGAWTHRPARDDGFVIDPTMSNAENLVRWQDHIRKTGYQYKSEREKRDSFTQFHEEYHELVRSSKSHYQYRRGEPRQHREWAPGESARRDSRSWSRKPQHATGWVDRRHGRGESWTASTRDSSWSSSQWSDPYDRRRATSDFYRRTTQYGRNRDHYRNSRQDDRNRNYSHDHQRRGQPSDYSHDGRRGWDRSEDSRSWQGSSRSQSRNSYNNWDSRNVYSNNRW